MFIRTKYLREFLAESNLLPFMHITILCAICLFAFDKIFYIICKLSSILREIFANEEITVHYVKRLKEGQGKT